MFYIFFLYITLVEIKRELMILSRFWDNFVSIEKKGRRTNLNPWKCKRKLIVLKKTFFGLKFGFVGNSGLGV